MSPRAPAAAVSYLAAMNRQSNNLLLTALLATALAAPALPGQAAGAGHSPSRDLEAVDEGANQLDKIGTMVDRNLEFVDERGYPFTLHQMFPGEQPVVLMLGYYSCPAMCGQVLDAALYALGQVELEPGDDYRMLCVSINPEETPEIAANRKDTFAPRLAKTGVDDAWHLLVGDEANTKALADNLGFNFYWSEATSQYAHPPSLMFLTPEGKLSRVIVNTYFEPEDVRLALVEASEGKLGTFWDQVKLNCMTFDPRTNSYTVTAMTLMRIGGAVTVVALGLMIWLMLRRERRQRAALANSETTNGVTDAATSKTAPSNA